MRTSRSVVLPAALLALGGLLGQAYADDQAAAEPAAPPSGAVALRDVSIDRALAAESRYEERLARLTQMREAAVREGDTGRLHHIDRLLVVLDGEHQRHAAALRERHGEKWLRQLQERIESHRARRAELRERREAARANRRGAASDARAGRQDLRHEARAETRDARQDARGEHRDALQEARDGRRDSLRDARGEQRDSLRDARGESRDAIREARDGRRDLRQARRGDAPAASHRAAPRPSARRAANESR
jgi:hypothetical protein